MIGEYWTSFSEEEGKSLVVFQKYHPFVVQKEEVITEVSTEVADALVDMFNHFIKVQEAQ